MSIMTEQLARHTVDNYRCSKCWGFLIMEWAIDANGQLRKSAQGEQLAEVKCRADNVDLGFVSLTFIEREKVTDFGNAFEVKRDLTKMGIITKEKAYESNL